MFGAHRRSIRNIKTKLSYVKQWELFPIINLSTKTSRQNMYSFNNIYIWGIINFYSELEMGPVEQNKKPRNKPKHSDFLTKMPRIQVGKG